MGTPDRGPREAGARWGVSSTFTGEVCPGRGQETADELQGIEGRGAWFLNVGRDLVEEAGFFHGSYALDLDDFGEGYLALTLIILEIIINSR